MNSCIVSPDSLKTSTKALPTRISKVTKATFDEDDIPLPVKEATIHRIMRKYKQFGTYNAEWHRKGRRPLLSLTVL